MSILTDTFTLNNGVAIPKVGFGTWQVPDGAPAYEATAAALAAGYRHIDTARNYGNEASVGRAIADSGLARDEVFITTKLPADIKDGAAAEQSFADSLDDLGVDAVDLYLIHAPWPWANIGEDFSDGNAEVWSVMEGLRDAGRARAIGVSNFEVDHLETLLTTARYLPQANQIKFYIGSTRPEITAYCQSNGILVEGFSPLATGEILKNADVQALAAKYDRTVAQLSIRYVLEKGVLPLPKTTTPSRMAENADLDFDIDAADVAFLDALTDTVETHFGPPGANRR